MIGVLRDLLNEVHESLSIIFFIDLWTVFFIVVKSLLLSVALAKIYQVGRDKYSSYYSSARSFFIFIFSFAMTLLLINKNILGAFSLIGAISIIRFRAVMKNPLDTGFFFLSLVAGASLAVHMMWEILIAFLAIYLIFRNFNMFKLQQKKRYFFKIENITKNELSVAKEKLEAGVILNIKSIQLKTPSSCVVELRSTKEMTLDEFKKIIGKEEGVCVSF